MPRKAGLAAALLTTGCFSIPPYTPDNAVTYTESPGGGATVSGTTEASGSAASIPFAIRFADGPGFHFPDQLLIEGVDILGHDASLPCFHEREVGLRIVPTARIGATTSAPLTKNLITPTLRGPAVTQVKVEWATQFKTIPQRAPGGVSTFTIFPDGQIFRHDLLEDTVATAISPAGNDCEPPAQSQDQLFTISSNWTVARDLFPSVTFDLDNQAVPAPTNQNEVGSNFAVHCLTGNTVQVTFAWPTLKMEPPPPLQTGVRGRPMQLDIRRDLGMRGLPTLNEFKHEVSSALFLSRDACTTARPRVEELAGRMPLTINGVATQPSLRDGMYGSDQGTPDAPGITGKTFTVAGTVKGAFAVWVRFPSAVESVRATITGATPQGAWYMPQQVDPTSWIVWFRDPLMNQTITIAPR